MGIRMHEFCNEYKVSIKEAMDIFKELGYKVKPNRLSGISSKMEKDYIAYLKSLQKELNSSEEHTPGKKNLFNIVKTWLKDTKTRFAQIRAVRSEDVESTKVKPQKIQKHGIPLREVAKAFELSLNTVHEMFQVAGADTVQKRGGYKVSKKDIAALKKHINNKINSLSDTPQLKQGACS